MELIAQTICNKLAFSWWTPINPKNIRVVLLACRPHVKKGLKRKIDRALETL